MIARLAIAMLCIVATGTGAAAAVRVCQQTVSSGEVIAGTEIDARRAALSAWKSNVGKAYGGAFTAWRLAQPKASKCLKVKGGFSCVALAQPCAIKQVAPPGSRGNKRPE